MMLLIGIITITSCGKEEFKTSKKSGNNISKIEIPHYNDLQDVFEHMSSASSCTVDSMSDKGSTQSPQIIGTLSDSFYNTIDFANFQNQDEAIEFYKNHSTMLDSTIQGGEISIHPKYWGNPYRYVANTDGLFAIGQYVYKIFKRHTVATKEDNLNALIALSETDIPYVDSSIFFVQKISNSTKSIHDNCDYRDNISNKKTIGNDRVVLELVTTYGSYPGFSSYIRKSVHTYSEHKSVGIWWTSRHTITCQGSVTTHEKSEGSTTWTEKNYPISFSGETNGKWIHFAELLVADNGADHLHYTSYYITSRTPGVAYAVLTH